MATPQAAMDSVGDEVENVETKKMKKKVFRFSQEMLDYYLSFRPGRVSRRLTERDPHRAAEMEKVKQRILTEQARISREYQAKGYATYEAEVPDDGTRYQREVTDEEEEEKEAPGVGKQAGAIIDEKNEEDTSVTKRAEVTAISEEASLINEAEVVISEKKEEGAATDGEVTNGAASLNFPQVKGRRRFRPGVVKQAGGSIKKIVM